MVSKMKEQLHALAAEWYVKEYASRPDAGIYYSTILHHYENANLHSEALQYALKAAEYLFFYYFSQNNVLLTNLIRYEVCTISISHFRSIKLLFKGNRKRGE